MAEITTALQLPFIFEEEKLLHDLSLTVHYTWKAHFNRVNYRGDWKVVPLYAEGGNEDHIFAHVTVNNMLPTGLLRKCTYFQEVINTFKCDVISARLLNLGAGAEIKPHTDHNLGYEDNQFRLHIPITTNEGVQFLLDGKQLPMRVGQCWYTNVNYIHSVKNTGTTDRIHLVLDLARNDWTDELFFSLAPQASFQKQEEVLSAEVLKQMIQELSSRNEPNKEHWIAEFEQQLKERNDSTKQIRSKRSV